MTRRMLLFVIALAFLAVRVPSLWQEPSAAEITNAGAARHFVLNGDNRPTSLRDEPPLASHIASPIAWALAAPAPEWDAAGPGTQIGWRLLYATHAPDDSVVPPAIVALGLRLPLLILSVLSFVLLERFATRFYGDRTGITAMVIVAGSAGLAAVAGRAVPAALAMPVMIGLMAAFDDHARSLQYRGNAPAWLFRSRSLTCGVAVGIALASSYAFVPIVAAALVWLAHRRRVVRRREDRVQRGALGRAIKGALAAVIVLGGLYIGEFGSPLAEGATHPALSSWAGLLGFDAASLADTIGAWNVPLPTWFRGLAHAGWDAGAPTAAERVATIGHADVPILAAIALGGLGAWPMLARDRVDTPSLLGVLGYTALATALIAAPRHATVAALAAIPPLAVLVAAWLARLARHFKTGAVVVGIGLIAAIAASWLLAAPLGADADHDGYETTDPPQMTAEDEWVANLWIAAHGPERVMTLLGREEKLRITEGSRVEEARGASTAMRTAAQAIADGENHAIIRGVWLPTPASIRELHLPTERLGPRLIVHSIEVGPTEE